MKRHEPSNGEAKVVLALFPTPFYTSTGIYFQDDLVEMGLERIVEGLSPKIRGKVMEHTENLARIQRELGLRFLIKCPEIIRLLDEKGLEKWVALLLDIYDAQGLKPALNFISGFEDHPEFSGVRQNGATFEEGCGILQHFLHGLGRREMRLEKGESVYTDTEVIYLPKRITIFQDQKADFQIYKLIVACQFYRVHLGSYRLQPARMTPVIRAVTERYHEPAEKTLSSDLSRFFHLFPNPALARDIFNLLDTARIESMLHQDLPGLYREMLRIKKALLAHRKPSTGDAPKDRAMEKAMRQWLSFTPGDRASESSPGISTTFQRTLCDIFGSVMNGEQLAAKTAELYEVLTGLPGEYHGTIPLFYAGELRPEEAERARRRKRESNRRQFREELAKLVADLPECETVRIELPDRANASVTNRGPGEQEFPAHLTIDGGVIPVPEAMQKIIEEIYEDLGTIPGSYLAVADEMSGHHFRSLCRMPEGTGYFLSKDAEDVHVLDEWDYRRRGYRKNWVLLKELESPEEDIAFGRETLIRYRGMIQQIKRQFERIRMEPKILRRQRDGDDVDLDAVVEAFADQHAGHHPSGRVFTHLRRDKRSIGCAFLVDLSGSTSGWINEMERTALLILCEAIGLLGDQIAVYGFSGQTRKRCELYRIKGFDEVYDDRVKRRIAGLRAREWTRLGPPIRYLSRLLEGVEAKTKLLITLSDGKPDDYDGYKGEYGIEDTKQALVEARRSGIHPFCITIDKAEHRYLSHMYGPANYVFINDLSTLPAKVPEIYRKLTT